MANEARASTGSTNVAGSERQSTPTVSTHGPVRDTTVLTALTRAQLHIDTFLTMATILRHSTVTGSVAFAVNVVFTLGFFWKGQSPKDQSFQAFMSATMCYVDLFMSAAMLLGFSASLAKYRWARRPDAPLSIGFWFLRLFVASFRYFVVCAIVVSAIGYASASLGRKWLPYQVHFYIGGLVMNLYTASLDAWSHKLFQTETLEGLQLGYQNRGPMWKRIAKAYRRDFAFVIAVYVASAYIHISTLFRPETERDLVIFSLFSVTIRIIILKATRYFVLKLKKIHLRQLYVAAAVPTVMINTQIRVALLNIHANVSLASVIAIALVEPIMRIAKVYFVRRDLDSNEWVPNMNRPELLGSSTLRSQRFKVSLPRSRKSTSISPRANRLLHSPLSLSPPASRSLAPQISHIPSTMSDSERCDQAKQRLLQFTAAEIHADMCSEYIAIACSMSIYYCLEGHPKFAWSTHTSKSESAAAPQTSRVQLVAVQILIEIIIDWLCSVWELANGIPLRSASNMSSFLITVFTGCAVSNIAVCCAFYMREP